MYTDTNPDRYQIRFRLVYHLNRFTQVYEGNLSDDGLSLEVEFQATSDISITCEFIYIQVQEDVFVTKENGNGFNVIGSLVGLGLCFLSLEN